MRTPERLAILISGGGTTMGEMVGALQRDPFLQRRIELAAIISSKPDAGGIQRAIGLGVPERDVIVIDPNDHRDAEGKRDQDSFGNRLAEEFRAREVTVFTQNGWLPTTPEFVATHWTGYNQHPGDPRDFGGLYGIQVHAAVLGFSDYLNRIVETFAVVQDVDSVVDGGGIVLYERVRVDRPTRRERELTWDKAQQGFRERVERLQKEVLPREHTALIRLLHRIAGHDIPYELMPRTVLPGEERIRDEAKARAKALYPHG